MKKKSLFKTNHLSWVLFILLLAAFIAPLRATNYYVDANNGDDSNDGTSPTSAWKTLSKVSSSSYSPGDSILLKRGETFRGQISIPNSGTAAKPITISAYGIGNKPLILGSVDYSNEALWSSLGNNLWTTAEGSFPSDIGFILFGEESIDNTGFKYIDHEKEQVTKEKDFWYDRDKKCIVVYSNGNPGQVYSSIEIGYNTAVHSHVIQGANSGLSYVHIENLEIKYYNSHAMAFVDATGIEVRDCDVSWGGGSGRYYFEEEEWHISRFGNGIEFWAGGTDCIVERCRIGQSYDSGLTFQGTGTESHVSNIIFRDNITFCNDMANFEIGFGNDNTTIKDTYYENNISIGAGRGWSREQKLRRIQGWDITTWYGHTKTFDGLNISKNVFYNPWGVSIFNLFETGITNFVMDYNYYYKPKVPTYDNRSYLMWLFDETESDSLAIYKTYDFEEYQSKTGLDKNSVFDYDRTVAQKASREKMPEWVYYLNSLFEEIEEVVSGNLPAKFDLASPADGSVVNGEVTLSWGACSATYSPLDHYEIWIDCEHVANVPSETTTYKTMLTNTEHDWFVVAICEDSAYWRQSSSNPKFTVTGGIPLYNLNVISGAGSGKYEEQDTITISPNSKIGKTFTEWTGDIEYLISSATTANNSVIMPASDVTISAEYKNNLYTLTVEGGSGSGSEYIYEQVVEILADQAPEGTVFYRWTGDVDYITNVNDSSTTVTIPLEDISISAIYRDPSENVLVFNWNMEAENVVLDEGEAQLDLINNGSIITGGTEPNPPGYGSVGAILNGINQYFSVSNSDYGNRALNGTDKDGTIYLAFRPNEVSSIYHNLFSFYRATTGERQLNIAMDNGKPKILLGNNDGNSVQTIKIYQDFSANEDIIIALSLNAKTNEYTFLAKDVDDDVYYSVTDLVTPLEGTYNTGTSDLTIGARSDLAVNGYANGIIYWVRVYDKAHSEEMMKEIIENNYTLEDMITSTDNSIVENSFFAQPNPVNSMLTISSRLSGSLGEVNIKVYNQIGEEVYHSSDEVTFPYQLDVSSFNSGIYLVKVSNGEKQEILKIVKK